MPRRLPITVPFTPAHPGPCAACRCVELCEREGARCVQPTPIGEPGESWVNPLYFPDLPKRSAPDGD